MSERSLESASTRELFGDFAGSYGEVKGLNEYFKVAFTIEYVAKKVEEKGYKIIDIPSMKDIPELYGIYESEDQEFGEGLNVWDLKRGIWVNSHDIERFERLIGIEDGIND